MTRIQTMGLLLLGLVAAAGCAGRDDGGYADDLHARHAGETPAASAAVDEPSAEVRADTVHYGTLDGRPLVGYMAVPAGADSLDAGGLPGVVVIHEWWGLNDNIRAMTRRLAGEGYRALAVDLYGGRTAADAAAARTYVQEAMAAGTRNEDNLTAAYRFLADRHAAPRVASLGWCFGGYMSLRAAMALPDALDAAVIYYGDVDWTTRENLAPLQMPLLAFFGGKDESIPVQTVRAFEHTLDALGKDAEVHVYDDAGHAFANPSGQSYVEAAATDAWERTTAFLREHLHGAPDE